MEDVTYDAAGQSDRCNVREWSPNRLSRPAAPGSFSREVPSPQILPLTSDP